MAILSIPFNNFISLAELEANYRNKKDEGLRYLAHYISGENLLVVGAENNEVGSASTMSQDEYTKNREHHSDTEIIKWIFDLTRDKVLHPERFARGD